MAGRLDASSLLRHSSVGFASAKPSYNGLSFSTLSFYKKKDVKKSKSLLVISKDIIYRKVD